MGRTAVNVTGQALVPVIVSARAGILDRAVYDAREQAVRDAVPDSRESTREPVPTAA